MSYLFRSKVGENNEKPAPVFDIPKECRAGVIVNEGPNFHVEVQMVLVPEPGTDHRPHMDPREPRIGYSDNARSR